jgi:hypothetical protein
MYRRPSSAGDKNRRSICHPRVDDLDRRIGEVVNIAGGESRTMTPTRGSNLGIGCADRPSDSLAMDDDVSVVSSCSLIERAYAVFEILRQKCFDTFGEVGPFVSRLEAERPRREVRQL